MRFTKLGRIFGVDMADHQFIRSHAQMPTPLLLEDRIRIYFSTRPEAGVSYPTFIDVDINNPARILYVHDQPLMPLGSPGSFDEHGVMPAFALRDNEDVRLYFTGWSRLQSAAGYNNLTGLALSADDGATFSRAYRGPLFGRTPIEPFSATLSWIERPGPTRWLGWYSSTLEWLDVDGRLENRYLICLAESEDGVNWTRDGAPVIPPILPDEAQARPTLVKAGDLWHMWFSYRGCSDFRDGSNAYRMGHAWSGDLRTWHRDDSVARIEPSAVGWDSKMIAYPYVLTMPDKILLFYNGNGFGQSGFGCAVLDF